MDTADAPTRVMILAGQDVTAMRGLLHELPAVPGVAVIVTGELAAGSIASNGWRVIESAGRQKLERDRVYLVPANHAASFLDGELVVDMTHAIPAPIDCLLRSASETLGSKTIAVILAGRGADGAIGLKLVKEVGGVTIVQEPGLGDDPDREMRHAAIATGMVDLVLPLSAIPERLSRLARQPPEPVVPFDEDDGTREPGADAAAEMVREILAMLRVRTGHDFSSYKKATLFRRIARRMQVCQTESVAAYQRLVREHPDELTHLLRDFLISVTSFSRDREAFEALVHRVIPRLFAHAQQSGQLRVWVAGCATGEEAYSIAMLLLEHAERIQAQLSIQIFATDIDEASLAYARAGRYPETIASDVAPERLVRFFTRENGHYRINKQVRDLVLFSPHNVLRDPPFSRIDLVSCRNLMIYLDREAQDRVLAMFHFGLRAEGFLFLGSSEATENASHRFAPFEQRFQIYTRRTLPAARLGLAPLSAEGPWMRSPRAAAPAAAATTPALSFGELHHRLVEHYAPPSILVNEQLDVVHVSERAGRFLEVPGGEPSRHLFRLVLPALRSELRSALHAARQRGTGSEVRRVQLADHGVTRSIEMRVRTIDSEQGRALLVMFDELPPGDTPASAPETSPLEPVVRDLEDELQRTRDQLRSTIEQYETSLEELKASNEELHAINEELRSASEELETSKEELQSVNEELTTVNHELEAKIEEVIHSNSDLQNLMTATELAVVFLDRELAVKRYTPRAQELFNVIPGDLGRPLAHLTHRLDVHDLPAVARTVLDELRPLLRDVRSSDGRRYLMRVVPYRSLENRIDGIVLTFVDVTELEDALEARQRSEAALHVTSERLQLALRGAPIVIVVLDERGGPIWSYAFGTELGAEPAQIMMLLSPEHAQKFKATTAQVLDSWTPQRIELDLLIDGEERTYDFRIERRDGGTAAVGFDITPSKIAETTLRELDRRKDEFLATLSHELRNPLTPLRVAIDVAKLGDGDPALREQSRAIIERQTVQLTKLVDDLLDLSRITQGKLALERVPVDPAVVVDEALEAMRSEAATRKHELRVKVATDGSLVYADQARLVQVLSNLVGNAIKYTPEGGTIDVDVALDRERRVLMMRVSDNGIGITPELQPHIFELFVQSRDSLGRSAGGLGIGLNLVRRLVALHDGRVSATSAGRGLGTTFTVELPVFRSEPT